MSVALRPADSSDADLLLTWRNDPVTRRSSFESGAVDRETHVAWLRTKLANRADCRIWIAEVDGVAVGQARVDRKAEHVGEISVALAPEARGRGLAAPLIRLATEQAHGELGLERIEARIKPENARSLAAFSRAGYRRVRTDDDAVILAAPPEGDGRD